jgi:hypothetical protein
MLVGAAMLLLPGPAILVIPLGLALLATEFAWARRLLRRFKKKLNHVYSAGRVKSGQVPGDNAAPQERKNHV